MILAIDVGNTHIVLGCLEGNQVKKAVKIGTDRKKTAHEYAAQISQILMIECIDFKAFEGTIISSVVPVVSESLSRAVEILTGSRPLVVGSGLDPGLALDMNGLTADKIAGDLLCTAVGAKEFYKLPAIIVDMGTAITLTVVSAEGVYLGGAIMPGAGTALHGLVSSTTLLPEVAFEAPDRLIAKDTVNAMKSGIVYGSAGAVDGLLDKYLAILGPDTTIIATGGMGRMIAKHCRHHMTVDGRLLLKGLGIIWAKNQK